ncbi:hypothetical protein GFS60_06927 (plasmid) [Rhodococcus sp. WAY2]|nr:hypothetical protein GFS60_06927 [Rhodococcus sp. WAY2]
MHRTVRPARFVRWRVEGATYTGLLRERLETGVIGRPAAGADDDIRRHDRVENRLRQVLAARASRVDHDHDRLRAYGSDGLAQRLRNRGRGDCVDENNDLLAGADRQVFFDRAPSDGANAVLRCHSTPVLSWLCAQADSIPHRSLDSRSDVRGEKGCERPGARIISTSCGRRCLLPCPVYHPEARIQHAIGVSFSHPFAPWVRRCEGQHDGPSAVGVQQYDRLERSFPEDLCARCCTRRPAP